MALPIVIVSNKIDLRSNESDDSGEEPVSYEEGFQFAEELAKKLGADGELHPVAFIETSALTGENIEEVFKTAASLYENTL
jgi:GTPase SAR1 family protein